MNLDYSIYGSLYILVFHSSTHGYEPKSVLEQAIHLPK